LGPKRNHSFLFLRGLMRGKTMPSLPSLPRLRQPPRPLLDVVNLGSRSGPGGHGAATSSGTPTSTAASQAASTDPENPANPTDPVRVSVTKSVVAGAVQGALLGTVKTAFESSKIEAAETKRRTDANLVALTPGEMSTFIGKATVANIIGGVVGGVAKGLVSATNGNAYNRAMQDNRGNEAKSWLRRIAEPAAAAYVGSELGKYAAKRTLDQLPHETGGHDLESVPSHFGNRRYV
jgi:hypothetical protein